MSGEPWYGVRLVYQVTFANQCAFEERVLVIRASDSDSAIKQAEQRSRDTYEDERTIYTGYAMAFNIFDECDETLPEGTEVFSLLRKSNLSIDDYLDRFHDTGNEFAMGPQ